MEGFFTDCGGRYARQMLQGILEVVIDEGLRLGANIELIINGAYSLHLGFGIGHGLADVPGEDDLLNGIGLGLGGKQEEGFLIGDDITTHALTKGSSVTIHIEQVIA